MGILKHLLTDPFQRDVYDRGQQIYDRITSGELRGGDNVEAALMGEHLEASAEHHKRNKG